jgi:hypothetical protein
MILFVMFRSPGASTSTSPAPFLRSLPFDPHLSARRLASLADFSALNSERSALHDLALAPGSDFSDFQL